MYASSLSSPSMLLRLLLLNALVIFGVPAGDRVTQSKPHLNESSEASISNQLNHGVSHQILMADALTTDYSKIGRNVGNDVELFGEGPIPVILRGTNLAFQVCDNCSGSGKVCYASNQTQPKAAEGCYGLVSNCRFEVDVHNKEYSFMGDKDKIFPNEKCPSFMMKYNTTVIKAGIEYPSCSPKYDHNKQILLYSFATSSCPIKIPNAYIPDPPTTISPPVSHEASDAAQSASFFETTEGIVVIVLFVGLIIGVFVVVILCLLCKKTKIFKSKAKEANVESIQVDQPEYTAVEEVKKSKTEVLKKKTRNMMNIEKKSMVEKKKKHAEAPKKTDANAPKKDMKAMEMVKKAAEEPAKIADEPKMKSDPTQEPTKTEDGPPPPAIDEDAGMEDDTPPSPPPPVVVVPPPSMPKNRASNAPQSKRHRRHHAKRAAPTFEAPPSPPESVIEKPRRPAAQPLPRKKKNMSPTLDSQDRERRTMIRNGQAVKPRPEENIRKYLPKNY